MKKSLKIAIYLFTFTLLAFIGLNINYVMPSYEETTVTGMEVRRMDKDGVISKSNPEDGPVRDVYFLFTENQDTKSVMVYRNEDTGWGLPPYLKFNSADIQAKAQAFANEKLRVEVKYYGWRIKWLNEFRNVLAVTPLKEGETVSKPWVSYFLYLALISLFIYLFRKIKKSI